jgi:hypothetical protein
VNNPPVGLVKPETDVDGGKRQWAHDPHLDPQLQWAGKTEHASFEVKGHETDQDRTKRTALTEWIEAVNEHGGFGCWSCDVSLAPSDVPTILARHSRDAAVADRAQPARGVKR